jgi:hypothetical protein
VTPASATGLADHGERTALALADRTKRRQIPRRDREHVALLRLVAPNLARRHARLFRRNRTQIDDRADAAAMQQFGQRIRQATGADVVDRQDRVRVAHLRAAVDDFLRAALDLGVAALHGIEIEIGRVDAGRHRRRGAPTHADQHAGTAEMNQERAGRERLLVDVRVTDIADAARDHDRLVVAAYAATNLHLERAEVAGQVRPPELVVERRRADRTVEHDRKRRCDALRLAVPRPRCVSSARRFPSPVGRRGWNEGRLPRLHQRGDAQMRRRVADEAGLRSRAGARRALVADLAAGAGRRARKRRDGGRMVVRLDLHQHVHGFAMRAIAAVRIGIKALGDAPFDHRRIVGVRDERSTRMRGVRCANHREQALRLRLSVDAPRRVEDLVPAMLRVCLREHRELGVRRVATEARECVDEVIDLVVGQRQAERDVGVLERAPPLRKQWNARERTRRNLREQPLCITELRDDRFGHPVVDERNERCALGVAETGVAAGRDRVRDAALDAGNRAKTAVVRDVGRFRRPRRDRAEARQHDECRRP